MSVRSTILLASLVATSSAYSQSPGSEVAGQAVRFSKETSTLHCRKVCVVMVGARDKVRIEAGRITSDRTTGIVTLEGSVRLVYPDGEVLADRATLTPGANGSQSFRSDEMRIVSPTFNRLYNRL